MYYLSDGEYERMKKYYEEKKALLEAEAYRYDEVQRLKLTGHVQAMKHTLSMLKFKEEK